MCYGDMVNSITQFRIVFAFNYNVFRRDRYLDPASTRRGGGVLLAVSSDIRADLVNLDSED